jgi:hypothetical protein
MSRISPSVYLRISEMSTTRVVLFFVCVLFSTVSHASFLYGSWYCGDDACEWASEPNLTSVEWLTDRGDGKPTTNVIIFAFVDPVEVLKGNGAPQGMTQKVVDYFKSKGNFPMRENENCTEIISYLFLAGMVVMFSIGGEEFSSDGKWDQALQDPVSLANNAASIAQKFGVRISVKFSSNPF